MSIFNRGIKNGVRGTARVISVNQPDSVAGWGKAFMRLVVQVPGRPAYQLEHDESVRKTQWPWPGTTLPVLVDSAQPDKMQVLWDEVPTSQQRAAADAQALADSLNQGRTGTDPGAPGTVPGVPGVANVQVVHMSDPAAMAQFGPMIEMAEQMTGRDLNGDGVIGPDHGGTRPPGGMPPGTPYGTPYGTPSGMPPGGPQYPSAGDAISQLERLAALHTAGQLTDDEFDEAKRRIIGR